MSITIDKLKVGDVLYDCHRHKAGNTTISVDGVWEVYVREIGTDERGHWAMLSWNGNPARKTYHSTDYKRAPKEWNVQGVFKEATCYLCSAKKSRGHRINCGHPAAVRARKKAAKGLAPRGAKGTDGARDPVHDVRAVAVTEPAQGGDWAALGRASEENTP